jgi:ketosteroid isomerase-like protein
MSQENFEVVRRSIEAWNRRDVATWLAVFSSDAEIDWSRARGPFKGVYRGRGKQEAFWDVFWSTKTSTRAARLSRRRAPKSWSPTPLTCRDATGSK